MYTCMYVCIYLSMYVCMYVYMHICIYITIYVCNIYIYIYIYPASGFMASTKSTSLWICLPSFACSWARAPRMESRTCHSLPASEIDEGLFWAVSTGSGGRYLFHRIGRKGRTWQLRKLQPAELPEVIPNRTIWPFSPPTLAVRTKTPSTISFLLIL